MPVLLLLLLLLLLADNFVVHGFASANNFALKLFRSSAMVAIGAAVVALLSVSIALTGTG